MSEVTPHLSNSIIQIAQALRNFKTFTERQKLGSMPFDQGLNKCLKGIYGDEAILAEIFIVDMVQSSAEAAELFKKRGNLTTRRRKYFLRKLSRLQRAMLAPLSRGTWRSFVDEMCDDEFVDDLEFIGESLYESGLLQDFSSHIDEMLSDTAELMELIKTSGLKDTTKKSLNIHLESVMEILSRARIVGASGVERELKGLLAEAIMAQPELVGTNDSLKKGLYGYISKSLSWTRGAANNIEAIDTFAGFLK